MYNFYPFTYEGVVLIKDNKAVVRAPLGHLCGYVVFKKEKILRL